MGEVTQEVEIAAALRQRRQDVLAYTPSPKTTAARATWAGAGVRSRQSLGCRRCRYLGTRMVRRILTLAPWLIRKWSVANAGRQTALRVVKPKRTHPFRARFEAPHR